MKSCTMVNYGDWRQVMLINETIYILGVRVDNLTLNQAVRRIRGYIDTSNKRKGARKVFFANVHSIHLARKNPDLYRNILNADLVLPDGSGLDIAGRLLNEPVKENLNGTDFIPVIFRAAERLGYSVYLLGAKPGTVDNCTDNLRIQFPNLEIAGSHHGYIDENLENKIIADINRKRPDILLVGMGSPLQEKWVTCNAPSLNVGVCFAVGGLFDFLSGEIERAPLWMRKTGMEWVHRFAQNPRDKWNRIFVEIPLFLFLILTRCAFHSNFYQLQNARKLK